ncbi:MAG: RNA polymerase sigma-70 factor [Saprospiraceae bacterium]
MNTSITATDKAILVLLKKEDESAMERIFDTYYAYLVKTAYHVLTDEHQAKDLVQDVLFHFWTKRDSLTIESGLKSYLRRSVVNRSIDQIRRKKRFGVAEEITDYNQASNEVSTQEMMETSDLQSAIMAAVDSLPERCKLIFSLSRFEDMSHQQIAEQLDISKKTIENQMTKALKTIRKAIQQYKDLAIFILAYFFG